MPPSRRWAGLVRLRGRRNHTHITGRVAAVAVIPRITISPATHPDAPEFGCSDTALKPVNFREAQPRGPL